MLTGRTLQAARERLFLTDPHCRKCRRVLTLDTMTRDHIIPLAEGGKDIESNTQILCGPCHFEKTRGESQRGRRRW